MENQEEKSMQEAIQETEQAWEILQQKMDEAAVIDLTVQEVVKGGVIGKLEGIRAFIPASQLSLSYVEDLSCFVGQTLPVKIIELDKEKRKLVVSHKEIAKAEAEKKKAEFIATLKVGEKLSGKVVRLASFGAFIDLGAADGLVHVSDMAWEKVAQPGDVVNIGDEVTVTVLKCDAAAGKISLSLKDEAKNPWFEKIAKYNAGDILDGKVVRLTDFGAFVELEPGLDGLVHISQISEERIATPASALNVGDVVKVKVLEIKKDSKRLALSIKQAKEKIETVRTEAVEYREPESSGVTIGDLFKDKLKEIKFE